MVSVWMGKGMMFQRNYWVSHERERDEERCYVGIDESDLDLGKLR